MTTEVPRDVVFISHATPEDNHFVSWLGAKLAAMGYDVWADVLRLRGGDDWAGKLETALRKRTIKMLLVCTPSGLAKDGVRREIEIGAQVAKQLHDAEFIVPLRLEVYEAPFRVALAQYVDFKRGWAQGLAELTDLLKETRVPCGRPGPMDAWLASHAVGAARILDKTEPLLSNWLEFAQLPTHVRYCEPPGGFPIDVFQRREVHSWPAVPHQAGVITFARPGEDGKIAFQMPAKLMAEVDRDTFLEEGWPGKGIDAYQARRMFSELGTQAFDKLAGSRGLHGYTSSAGRISW
jgi:hypothetical protein